MLKDNSYNLLIVLLYALMPSFDLWLILCMVVALSSCASYNLVIIVTHRKWLVKYLGIPALFISLGTTCDNLVAYNYIEVFIT